MKNQDIKKYHLLSAQVVYTDQYFFQDTVRLYNTKGKSYPSDILSVQCVFIDNSSFYMSIKHQVAINTTENVKSKINFDREAQIQ